MLHDPFWLILAAESERPRPMQPQRSPWPVLAIALVVLTALFFGARMQQPKKCSCDVCTDTYCKVCSCGINGKCCGDGACPKCRSR